MKTEAIRHEISSIHPVSLSLLATVVTVFVSALAWTVPSVQASSTSTSLEALKLGRDSLSVEEIRARVINEDLLITFSEFSVNMPITDQYSHLGIVFSGDAPFITTDSANPTSPVLSGSPRFQGAIEGRFVDPRDGETPVIVSGFSLDAGFFDELGSVRLQWFDIEGRVLGQRASSMIGIENFRVEGSSIHRWRIEIVENEPAGFAIDNVSFSTEVRSSLLFREKSGDDKDGTWGFFVDAIPGFDHIGLHVENVVYESHPGYPAGVYTSADGSESVNMNKRNGVQAQHGRQTFEHDAMPGEPSPVVDFDEIVIPEDLATAMRSRIQDRIQAGARFQFIDFSFPDGIEATLTPRAQKGGGSTFTCVGLVEWAAEGSGHKDGQGFVPNFLESFTYPIFRDGEIIFREAPLLSPQLLNMTARFDQAVNEAQQWLQGFLDPVDFVITDPLGRRLGFTPAAGELNEIPGAFFSGDGNLEQFLIPNPLPGPYNVELFGRGERVAGSVNIGGQILSIDQVLGEDESVGVDLDVRSVAGSRGDTDLDGDVDLDDLALLVGRLNTFVNDPNDPADINADGLIEQADADLLQEICTRPGCARGRGRLCGPNPEAFCLQASRFRVEVEWADFEGGRGTAQVVPINTPDSGIFWFFNPENWELMVKVLDGCDLNDNYWVFAAATTNVEYTLRVTDTATGAVKEYFNPLGNAAPAITDTTAFETCRSPFAGENVASHLDARTLAARSPAPATTTPAAKGSECRSGGGTLCLNQGRFEVTVAWRDFDGNRGSGQVAPLLSSDSGIFWFFDPQNWELLVKVLDGCSVNDRFWVFSAATTNVAYTLRVRDTVTGDVKIYENPLGVAADATTDTDAFASCP